MIVYEVNLRVQNQCLLEFKTWLTQHVQEMLELPYFSQAKSFKRLDEESEESQLIVHYYCSDRNALDEYFQNDAERMRADGLARFEGRFTASRRILETDD